MRLIKNEWMKLWAQRNTWVMLILTLAVVALFTGLDKYFDVDQETKDQRIEANQDDIEMYTEWAQMTVDEADKAYYAEEILMAEYRIANDLKSSSAVTFDRNFGTSLTVVLMLAMIFGVVVAAGIVSNEFGTGTIKMLLTRPVARWKILMAKLVTPIFYSVILTAVGIAFAALCSVVFFGTELSVPLVVQDGVVVEQALELTYLSEIGYSLLSMLMTVLFAFMIGTLFGSSTLAVSVSLVLLLMGSMITMYLSRFDFAKYVWFANDFAYFAPGSTPVIDGLTIGFATGVNIVYAIIFLTVTFGIFTKRDVTA